MQGVSKIVQEGAETEPTLAFVAFGNKVMRRFIELVTHKPQINIVSTRRKDRA
jgi:hypothetical protein